MSSILRSVLLLVLLLFSFGANAATSYSLPADIGTGAFSNCSGGGGVFNCTGDLTLSNNDSVLLTGDVTLNINGNLDTGNGISLDNNGFVFNINVDGTVVIGTNAFITADITAVGDITIANNSIFTGNISSGGNIVIGNNGDFTGDITAAGTLGIGVGTVVIGTCTPFHPQCTGGGSPPLDHFNINVGAGAANTCNPFNFTVTAEDSGNNPVTDYTGTVSLTTSTSNGNFSTVTATNNVNPNPDNDDNGSADYTFDLLDTGSVTLSIANEHAETLTLSVSDASVPVTSISSIITFSDNAFTIIR